MQLSVICGCSSSTPVWYDIGISKRESEWIARLMEGLYAQRQSEVLEHLVDDI